jgi:WD40 repeat protein
LQAVDPSLTSLSFFPDGKKIIAGVSGSIIIWDTDTKKVLQRLRRNERTGRFASVVLSPDGKKIVAVSVGVKASIEYGGQREITTINSSLQIWDIELEKELQNLEEYGGRDVALSPDGTKIATAGCDGIVKILDAESVKVLKKLEGHIKDVFSVAFSPDGKKIVTAGDDTTVRIWTLE